MNEMLLHLSKLEQENLAQGYCVIDNFLSPQQCQDLLESIAEYRANHKVPEVIRESPQNNGRSLHYWVIDGLHIESHLSKVWHLYHDINDIVKELSAKNLTTLENKQVGLNINIMKGGCEYRWHYDRNAITAILYLNAVDGGNTELYPNYRLHLGKYKHTKLQKKLDLLLQTNFLRRLFTKKHIVEPRQGRILIMQADKCLHSVSSIEDNKERINMILAYDYPKNHFAMEKQLDAYLYTQEKSVYQDPNYLG